MDMFITNEKMAKHRLTGGGDLGIVAQMRAENRKFDIRTTRHFPMNFLRRDLLCRWADNTTVCTYCTFSTFSLYVQNDVRIYSLAT
jgi:hypothetical protein